MDAQRRDALASDLAGDRRLFDRELDSYLGLLRRGELRLDTTGEVDSWLERIAATGLDVGPAKNFGGSVEPQDEVS